MYILNCVKLKLIKKTTTLKYSRERKYCEEKNEHPTTFQTIVLAQTV